MPVLEGWPHDPTASAAAEEGRLTQATRLQGLSTSDRLPYGALQPCVAIPRSQPQVYAPQAELSFILKSFLVVINILDLIIVLALFVAGFFFDKGTVSTPQWILLPMLINRCAAFFAIWRDLLYVAPSMLQISLALINLILATQSSNNRCVDKSVLQCRPVATAVALLIAEAVFTMLIAVLVMWAPVCCMTAASEDSFTVVAHPPFWFDASVGHDSTASAEKDAANKFVQVENPGGQSFALALRVERPGKYMPGPDAKGDIGKDVTQPQDHPNS
eukprot:jgi/Botrbrau1/5671/Bobra.0071s0013.1